MCESHLTLHSPDEAQSLSKASCLFNNVKQLIKKKIFTSKVILSFSNVFSCQTGTIFKSLLCVRQRKAIALTLLTVLAAEIRPVQRQLLCKAVGGECCLRSRNASALRLGGGRTIARGILQLFQYHSCPGELNRQVSRVGMKNLEASLRKEMGIP